MLTPPPPPQLLYAPKNWSRSGAPWEDRDSLAPSLSLQLFLPAFRRFAVQKKNTTTTTKKKTASSEKLVVRDWERG